VARYWWRTDASNRVAAGGGLTVALQLHGHVTLPPHAAGGFDHGDVLSESGRVFVAHTAFDSVNVIDDNHVQTVMGCNEGSGVLCTQDSEPRVFAAARGAGKVQVIDARSLAVRRDLTVGPKPNGLAWDASRRQLLVADVEDFQARLLEPSGGTTLASTLLPGRPRWCVFDRARDRFLVNVREPACVVALGGGTAEIIATIDVSAAGPHGMDIDTGADRAFVACDASALIVLDLTSDREVACVPIGGEPDAIWFNARANLLYVAIGNPGIVDVVDCQRTAIVERVTTEPGAHTTAFDAQRQRLYVFLPGSSRAAVFEEAR
jgi:DNA-binding beta-propeller fold protein YncE